MCLTRQGRFLLKISWLLMLLGPFAALPITAAEQASAAPEKSDASASVAVPGVTPDYKLGPGDVVQIYVWRNPELTVSVPVRPDGKISTPLVDDLVAVGKSPSQLARDVEVALAEYVLTPKVNVIVTASTSAASQVKVIGQVRAPQAIPYRTGMTALDAIIAVGGLTEFAAGNRSRILRKNGEGQEQSLKVGLADIVKGKLKKNIALSPGDVIVVPESLF
jgi:polysaccharide export outer membrane protein